MLFFSSEYVLKITNKLERDLTFEDRSSMLLEIKPVLNLAIILN